MDSNELCSCETREGGGKEEVRAGEEDRKGRSRTEEAMSVFLFSVCVCLSRQAGLCGKRPRGPRLRLCGAFARIRSGLHGPLVVLFAVGRVGLWPGGWVSVGGFLLFGGVLTNDMHIHTYMVSYVLSEVD